MALEEIALEQVDACWRGPEKAVLVTSVDAQGRPNVLAVGWLMRASMAPPVYAIGLSRRSHSSRNISEVGEFVLAVPGPDLATALVYCGTHSGTNTDKFAGAHLTPVPARTVRPPLVQEALANLECGVMATQDTGDHRVFFGQVRACWLAPERRQEPQVLVVGELTGYATLCEHKGLRLGIAQS